MKFDGSASTGSNLTYSWDFDDPNDSTAGTGETPSHTYPAGTYNVSLTVTDSCDRSDTDNTTMVLTIHGACGALPDTLTFATRSSSTTHYFKATFNPAGGDIVAGDTYWGWCAHSGLDGLPEPESIMNAYCTLELVASYWSNINWIVNNYSSSYNKMEVQHAIWYFIHHNGDNVHDYAYGLSSSCSYSRGDIEDLINAAESHGDFCPGIDEKYVVLLTFEDIGDYGTLYRDCPCPPPDPEQNVLIEVDWVNHCD
jgi:hypothetical protein